MPNMTQKPDFLSEVALMDDPMGANGPFSLEDDAAYQAWRELKLVDFPDVSALVVNIEDPAKPTPDEILALNRCIRRTGMAVFKGPVAPDEATARDLVAGLGLKFGLSHLDLNPYADDDAITPLHVAAGAQAKEQGRKLYIPYTDRAISWHTDGYYNPPERRIRAMVLYCLRAAAVGGENALYDSEIAYILMRDADPAMVCALGHPEAMTIPANDVDDAVSRGDVTGPVFSLNRSDGTLHMRYTARKRNVVWRDDPDTSKAVQFLEDLLATDSPYLLRHRLSAGEGLICNNVLHTRTAFEDGDEDQGKRMILRARYLDRIATP